MLKLGLVNVNRAGNSVQKGVLNIKKTEDLLTPIIKLPCNEKPTQFRMPWDEKPTPFRVPWDEKPSSPNIGNI